jgi:hypothetical protein
VSHFSNFVISAYEHIYKSAAYFLPKSHEVCVYNRSIVPQESIIDVCIHESVMWPPMCVYSIVFGHEHILFGWKGLISNLVCMWLALSKDSPPPFQNGILPKWMVNIFSYGHYFLISPRGALCFLPRGGCILVPSSCYWIFNLCQLKTRIVNILLSKDHVHDIISFKSRFITTCTICLGLSNTNVMPQVFGMSRPFPMKHYYGKCVLKC